MVLVAVVTGLVGSTTIRGAIEPTKGTFDGIYHRDRWGVGRFEWFVVGESLQPRLAAFDGRPIRVEVTKGEQRTNPGPAFMLELGSVTLLDQAAVSADIRVLPPTPAPNQPFQVVCTIENRSSSTIEFDLEGRSPLLHLREPGRRDSRVTQFNRIVTRGLSMDSPYLGTGRVRIAPGDRFPLTATFEDGLPAGEFELSIDGRTAGAEPTARVFRAVPLDVKGAAAEAAEAHGFAAQDASVRPIRGQWGDAYDVAFTVKATASGRRIAVPSSIGMRCSGRLRALDAAGNVVDVGRAAGRPEWPRETSWSLGPVPEGGITAKLSAQRRSYFPESPIVRWVFDLATDEGIETLEVASDFRDAIPALPDFGPSTAGVTVRVRLDPPVVERGARPYLRFQAVNGFGKPIVWWAPLQVGGNFVFELDGHEVAAPEPRDKYVHGWAAPWTCPHPHEWSCPLPEKLDLARGRHVLRCRFRSHGSTYKNASNADVPVLDGELVSNEFAFEVR